VTKMSTIWAALCADIRSSLRRGKAAPRMTGTAGMRDMSALRKVQLVGMICSSQSERLQMGN